MDSGWVSRVYLVDGGRYVVKFPRRDESRGELARDVAALALLGDVAGDVRLPRVLEAHQDYDHVVYEGVVGVGLDTAAGLDAAAGLGEAAWRSLGRALGSFLRAMHARELPGAPRMTVEDEIVQLHRAYRQGRGPIETALGSRSAVVLDALIGSELPSRMLELGDDPALCHGDLGVWNLVLAPDGRLGVIDFGDAGLWDRSKDFMGLAPAPMLEAALAAYGEDEPLRRKVGVRQQVLPFLDLPYFVATGDVARARRTMSRIAQLLAGRA